jgi:hypothetical protein
LKRLLEKPPEGGWINELRTRKSLVILLDDYETKRMENPETATTSRLTKSNLPGILIKWFKEDEILAIYHKYCKETLSKPMLPDWKNVAPH